MADDTDYLYKVLEYLYPIEDRLVPIRDILKELSIPNENDRLAVSLYDTLCAKKWVNATPDENKVLLNANGRLHFHEIKFNLKLQSPINNTIGINNGNVAQFGSASSLNNLSQSMLTTKPINPINNNIEKSFWTTNDTKKLVIGILIVVIAAIILYFFKIPS